MLLRKNLTDAFLVRSTPEDGKARAGMPLTSMKNIFW